MTSEVFTSIAFAMPPVNSESNLRRVGSGYSISCMGNLQERLKRARELAGLSQGQLAKAVGITQPTYSLLENTPGKRTKHIVTIANALGVRPEWLNTGEGPMQATRIGDAELDAEVLSLWDQIEDSRKPFLLDILRTAAQRPSGLD